MNKLSLTVAAILSLSGAAAHACTCGPGTVQSGDVCVPSSTDNGSKSNATSNQAQGQVQSASAAAGASSHSASASNASNVGGAVSVGVTTGANEASGGTGGRSSSVSAGGNAQGGSASVSDNSQSGASSNAQSTTYQAARIPVGTAVAGFQQTTAGCRFAEGLGIQLTSAGTSVGLTFKDHDCVRFELAQFFYSRGQDIAGDRIICAVHEVRATLGDDCEALVHQIVATVPSDAVSHAEMRAGFKALNQQKDTAK